MGGAGVLVSRKRRLAEVFSPKFLLASSGVLHVLRFAKLRFTKVFFVNLAFRKRYVSQFLLFANSSLNLSSFSCCSSSARESHGSVVDAGVSCCRFCFIGCIFLGVITLYE